MMAVLRAEPHGAGFRRDAARWILASSFRGAGLCRLIEEKLRLERNWRNASGWRWWDRWRKHFA